MPAAFDALKTCLVSPPILAYPNSTDSFILDTDASNCSIGGVLSQVQGDQEHVIAYFSRALNSPEKNYCVTRLELLAVVESVKHFHHYLYGKHFVARSDHAALQWLRRLKNPEGQMARWIARIDQYDFEIRYRAGGAHLNADALSRRPCDLTCKHCRSKDDPDSLRCRQTVVGSSQGPEHQPNRSNAANREGDEDADDLMADIRTAQQQDDDIGPILQHLVQDPGRPRWDQVSGLSPESKRLWSEWSALRVQDGMLEHNGSLRMDWRCTGRLSYRGVYDRRF